MSTFLLIHGAGHGGWCWDEVAAVLTAAGHQVHAPDLPCDDLEAGIAEYATAATADLTPADHDHDLVVVGHSLGAITAAVVASARPVRRLAFVAGIITAPGKSLADLAETDADRDVPLTDEDYVSDDAGRFRFTESGARRALYQDCTEASIQSALPRLRYQRSLWALPAPFDAWPDTEIVSVICRDDRVVNADWLRRISVERLGVQPAELDGGHSPMMSRPTELAALLLADL